MRLFLVVLVMTFNMFFLYAEESSFKFTFGSNLGNVPFEINKMSKNIKKSPGIKINSWILSPNFSSFVGDIKNSNFKEDKNFKEALYIKLNYKF
ncbi:hypothetical protein OAS47_00905 [Pelagibacteraceae bacterium]|nr:hypothetical protein [Pelagibacteraceae bacterium]